ncbi:hypothetical protein QJS10_CPA03g02171 [Acorus calamus]|uniref:Uncharacterized protein n=1 Tax=Acorus calamus TaxID=4465 RepID=A0AAV9F378_ACOCL|nr:hypothetical protein QJS10_CPA03g02171 [Acorus calamus]
MVKFALGANSILNEMRQKVEDMVQETSRQRQRAEENEHVLYRVKQDFESLKSYVGSLINGRETLLSSEKQFQTIEKLFESGYVEFFHQDIPQDDAYQMTRFINMKIGKTHCQDESLVGRKDAERG